jgi:LuxR family transcriptional regulator, maltose regulon positive regulatory protein
MGESGEHQGDGRSQRAGGSSFDLVAAKLHSPLIRPGTVRRSRLIERLAGDVRPIVSVVAPAGYGKTTLLAQWAERSGQPVAWVSVDEADNDPKVLLSYVAEALDAVEPVDARVFDALSSPGSSVPGSVVPRLGSALASMSAPVVLMLDDVHLLDDPECWAALSVLADHLPAGSRLALAGRTRPPLRVARLRAEGRILELGPRELSLTREEASTLLRNAGLTLGEQDVAALHRRTEGWPAGLYLAALYLREGGPLASAAVSFGGGDRLVSEYVESEFLARISRRQRLFLTRTAVLERMCGPLCDAVLEQSGSATVLAELDRSNLLLVPLDRGGEWYRYHHLFRDMLRAELRRVEPELMPVLQRRAAQWYERNQAPGEALEYRMKAGDVDDTARLATALAFATYQRGRAATAERWLGWLEDHGALEKHPAAAVLAAMLPAMTGKPADAERRAGIAEHGAGAAERGAVAASLPDGSLTIEPWLALLRALLCRDGVEQMRADAELAAKSMAPGSFWRASSLLFVGVADLMAGDPDQADVLFADHVAEGRSARAMTGVCFALSQRSLLAITRGEWDPGERHLSEAQAVAREANLEDYPTIAIMYAVAARMALHRADPSHARAELIRAQRLRPALTYAVPHFAVQARTELTKAHLALGDLAGARTLMREAGEILRRRPGLGAFAQQARDLRAELSRARRAPALGASALTAAELRLLPMLATHLSFPEIAAEVFLSPNTIKSTVHSIYRKLGTSSRHQAVSRLRDLGLIEA